MPVTLVRVGGTLALAVWLAGVSGALDWVPSSPTANGTALVVGLVLIALGGAARAD